MKLTEEEIKEFAKDNGIKRAANKKTETLLEELAEAGFTDIELKEPMPEPKAEEPEEKPEPVKVDNAMPKERMILEQNANPKDWERVLMVTMGPSGKKPYRLWVPKKHVAEYEAQGYRLVEG